jgi:hypothetical protein
MKQDQNPSQNHSISSNWGNFFKEFLMLFLAVFCGYLAEDFREGHQERWKQRIWPKNFTMS